MVKKILSLFCLDFTEIDRELAKLRDLKDSFANIGVPVPIQRQHYRPDDSSLR